MKSNGISNTETSGQEQTVPVLYQRLGDKWYAFSLVNEEVFFGEVAPEALEPPAAALAKSRHGKSRSGNA